MLIYNRKLRVFACLRGPLGIALTASVTFFNGLPGLPMCDGR